MLIKIILSATLLISFFLAAKIMKTYKIEQENELMQSYMTSMQEFYENMQSKIEAVKKYRHDLANHIQTLEVLLNMDSHTEDVQEYYSTIKQQYDSIAKSKDPYNTLMHCILLIKKQICEQRNIFFSIQIDEIFSCSIEELDLACLLHNLLDNSIEEQNRIPDEDEKGIWVIIEQTDDLFSIYIKNKIRKGTHFSFQTHKSNPEEHGIGTTIIKELVEKYEGSISFSIDRKCNTLEEKIIFPV